MFSVPFFSVGIGVWGCSSISIYCIIPNEYFWVQVQRQDNVIPRRHLPRCNSYCIWDARVYRWCGNVLNSIIWSKVSGKILLLTQQWCGLFPTNILKDFGGSLLCYCNGSLHGHIHTIISRKSGSHYLMEWNCPGNRIQPGTSNWWIFLWHSWILFAIYSNWHFGYMLVHLDICGPTS